MKIIHKVALGEISRDTAWRFLPGGSKVLSVTCQGGDSVDDIQVWYYTPDQRIAPHPYRFKVFGTGTPVDIEERDRFLGTVQLYGGKIVLHIFVTENE